MSDKKNMKESISYSAPAKVILSGEHAVVYGKPALVTAVDLRLTITLIPDQEREETDFEKKIRLHFENIVHEYLQKKRIPFQKRKYGLEVENNIPVGRGLGSSAALSVSTIACLLHFYIGKKPEQSTVSKLAHKAERFFHANPSGVDVSASTYGGLIYYRKEFEFLKNISLLNFKIPKKFQDHLVLIDTGAPKESTAEMVNRVKDRYNRKPRQTEAIFQQTEKSTKRMVVSIVKEDEDMFKESLRENGQLLIQLGVVSQSAQKLLEHLEAFGISKVTGAGGFTTGSGFILMWKEKSLPSSIQTIEFQMVHEGLR